MGQTINIPDPADSWAQVELHRWQYGELPQPTDMRPLNVAEGLRKMADAIQTGCHREATAEQRENMPAPFNVCSVMRYAAKLFDNEIASGIAESKTPDGANVGRNYPCPCGSGKKFKKCCLLVSRAKVDDSRRLRQCIDSIYDTVEGLVDGADDRGEVANLANSVMHDLEALKTGDRFSNQNPKGPQP
jgi:hypothetical protein